MIFVTVGTQAPFDRLIKIIDEIAVDISEPIIAQTCKSEYVAQNIQVVNFLSPSEFNKLFEKARVVVAHAGMGTIISALLKNKPIIIFPRMASLGEQRNEHQKATAMKMEELNYVYVAYDKQQLAGFLRSEQLRTLHEIGEFASPTLTSSINNYLTTL